MTVEHAVKAFLLSHLRALSQIYDITVIVNTNNPNFLTEAGIKVKVIQLKFVRDISLFSDLICLFKLIKIFHQQRFVSVHSLMPKSGLLAMLAAWLACVPLRIHTFTGQVWYTQVGFKRVFLRFFDILIGKLTTINMADGNAQLQFLINKKIISAKNAFVFAKGSIAGVDSQKFKSDQAVKQAIRQQLLIKEDALVFLYLGRLNYDKGIMDLAAAFNELNNMSSCLVFVGPDEKYMQARIVAANTESNCRMHFVGYTENPQAYIAAADVLCLPSYREGFNNVTIEAAAVGVPAIASRIYGITDAVLDGETGLLHEPRDVDAIKQCMQTLIDNKQLRLKLGEQARARAIKDFDSNVITQAWVKFYLENVPE